MRVIWISVAALLVTAGCGGSSEKHGQCEAPKEDLKILFKPKGELNLFSHSFCIVCNSEIEPDEYGDWALEMGAPEAPTSVENLHPCLYVYGDGRNIATFVECVSVVCEGGAKYNDMVGTNNGNFDVGPLLE